MATLRGMVRRFGQRGTARILTSQGTPVTSNTIKSAIQNPKGKGYARLNDVAKGLPRPGKLLDPGERAVSSTNVKNAPRKVVLKGSHGQGGKDSWAAGKQDTVNKRTGAVTHVPSDLTREQVENDVAAAKASFGTDPQKMVNVAFRAFFAHTTAYTSDPDPDIEGGVRRYVTWTGRMTDLDAAIAAIRDELDRDAADAQRFVQGATPEANAERAAIRLDLDAQFAQRLCAYLTGQECSQVTEIYIYPAKEFRRQA